jgi:hypothetical protein
VPAEGFFSVPLVLIAVCIAWSGCALPAGLTTSWHLKNDRRLAGICFLVSGFIKETSLIALGLLRSDPAAQNAARHGWHTWLRPAVWCLPVAAWCGWLLWAALAEAGVRGNFDWPGFALVRHLRTCAAALLDGNLDSRYLFGFFGACSLAYQSVFLLLRWREKDEWLRLALPFALLFWMLGDIVWHGYWAAARACLPMTFVFNRRLLAETRFAGKLALGNLHLLHSVYRFLP